VRPSWDKVGFGDGKNHGSARIVKFPYWGVIIDCSFFEQEQDIQDCENGSIAKSQALDRRIAVSGRSSSSDLSDIFQFGLACAPQTGHERFGQILLPHSSRFAYNPHSTTFP